MYIDINLQKRYEALKKLYKNGVGEYIDRTEIIEHLNSVLDTESRYVCINSAAPNGKSVMADMLASYYSDTVSSSVYFEQTMISDTGTYIKHLNKHNVIYMSMKCNRFFIGNYIDYICRVEERIIKKLADKFFNINVSLNNSVWYNLNEIYMKTGNKFIFIIDDWDYVFNVTKFTNENCVDYIKMLIDILSGCEYVELAYLTGKYPVSRFIKSRKMSMFSEFELASFRQGKNENAVAVN